MNSICSELVIKMVNNEQEEKGRDNEADHVAIINCNHFGPIEHHKRHNHLIIVIIMIVSMLLLA